MCDCAKCRTDRAEQESNYEYEAPAISKSAARTPAPPAVQKPTNNTNCILLDKFDLESNQIKPHHEPILKTVAMQIVQAQQTNPNRPLFVELIGHTDKSGAEAFNERLGNARADSVQHRLRAVIHQIDPRMVAKINFRVSTKGEREPISRTAALNRRVQVCIQNQGVTPPPPVRMPPARGILHLTAKSFIAHIGGNIGSLSNNPLCPYSSVNMSVKSGLNIINPGLGTVYGMIPTNAKLKTLAVATDKLIIENPRDAKKDKGYRLYSNIVLELVRGVNGIVLPRIRQFDIDAGMEGPLHGSISRDINPRVDRISPTRLKLTWGVKGAPHAIAEQGFQGVCRRTAKQIWHRVTVTIDFSGAKPVVLQTQLLGSHFPSHRVFVDNKKVANKVQAPFSSLWKAVSGDPSRVQEVSVLEEILSSV